MTYPKLKNSATILQWYDLPKDIEYVPKKETILLFGGLTPVRERLIKAAANSLGERYEFLPNADIKSFEYGKIYGNKAQCNPTYFTVGNLIKYLIHLRDNKGLSTQEIIKKYLYITANGCGPCRFGMYVTEYKKALRDAGFEGFRVVAFEHNKSIFQEANEDVVNFSPKYFLILIKSVIIGDILTILGFQLRPYESKKGSVDIALKKCQEIIIDALNNKKSLLLALNRCKKIIQNLDIDKSIKKPKVMVMGEFWAAMTQSDGNYNIHRFLEQEGAEVLAQPVINRVLLNVWESEYLRARSEGLNSSKSIDFSNSKKKFLIWLGKKGIRAQFKIYAKAIGLKYELDDMDYLYNLGRKYYPVDSNGGEGHLEVAHLIEAIEHKKADLVISIKPFGCMPSSGVSDAIASLVASKYPQANFISLETSGDGEANFYSRVQMALFKAKERLSSNLS